MIDFISSHTTIHPSIHPFFFFFFFMFFKLPAVFTCSSISLSTQSQEEGQASEPENQQQRSRELWEPADSAISSPLRSLAPLVFLPEPCALHATRACRDALCQYVPTTQPIHTTHSCVACLITESRKMCQRKELLSKKKTWTSVNVVENLPSYIIPLVLVSA